MKQITLRSFLFSLVFTFALGFASCKNKAKNSSTDTDTSTNMVNNNGVNVATDEELNQKVTDATKDYPTVQATVTNGEITLAGSIDHDKLPKLMEALHGLNPKKIDNSQLEVK